jgi:hypothetical protein
VRVGASAWARVGERTLGKGSGWWWRRRRRRRRRRRSDGISFGRVSFRRRSRAIDFPLLLPRASSGERLRSRLTVPTRAADSWTPGRKRGRP